MSVSQRKICVSVDIDAIRHYHAIHGLRDDTAYGTDPVWTFAISRFLDLFARLELRATFFVVASDLIVCSEGGAVQDNTEVLRRRQLVRQIISSGHEVASHSFQHDYALSVRPRDEIRADLVRARDVLNEVIGKPVCGFRAPGYNLSHHLINAIRESGALYSSSRFPSPPYFAAKWLVMLKLALTRHASKSIVGELTAPFRPRRLYRHRGGLLELPISVISFFRLPAIGTFFILYGDGGRRWLLPALAQERWLNLEFHGIDLLDARDLGIGQDLVRSQFDLRFPVVQKDRLIKAWLSQLADARTNLTLDEVAKLQTSPV